MTKKLTLVEGDYPFNIERLKKDVDRLKKNAEKKHQAQEVARMNEKKQLEKEYQMSIKSDALDMMKRLQKAISKGKTSIEFVIATRCSGNDLEKALTEANDIASIIRAHEIDALVWEEDEPDIAGAMSDDERYLGTNIYIEVGVIF